MFDPPSLRELEVIACMILVYILNGYYRLQNKKMENSWMCWKCMFERQFLHKLQIISNVTRAELIIGSATRFGRVSDTRQCSEIGRHKLAETE